MSPDGNEVAVGSHYDQPGDWLGSVYVFTKPADGWADASDSEQYVGPVRNGRFGWATAVDGTTGAILASIRQEKAGDTCGKETSSVTLGDFSHVLEVTAFCLRYMPVYVIDR